MSKATPIRASFGSKNMGVFHAENYNMFEADDLSRYADFRNLANDASNGIKIEMMREYTRKTTVREGAGEDQMLTTSEEIVLVVHYWANPPKRDKGDNDEELTEARREWSSEQKALG